MGRLIRHHVSTEMAAVFFITDAAQSIVLRTRS
jgi:hypothetical protein